MKVVAGLLAAFPLSILPSAGVDARAGTRIPAAAWEIGPIINNRNYSPGLSRPSPFRDGWGFTIGPRAEPHYVTFRHGSLRGKTQIRMRFRVEGPKGAIIHGASCPTGSPSLVTLYFQRGGDDWASDGGRWWASFAKVSLRGPMPETEIVAPLNARWTSVLRMNARSNPNEFAAAKANADRVGFTFGNCEGFGHGARATVPVRFVVTSFQVL
jgi:hypothetical protein